MNKQLVSPGEHCGGALVRNKWGLFCGHYLNAYVTPSCEKALTDSYAEEIGLPPSQLGTPTIEIKPDEKAITITLPMTVGDYEAKTMPIPKVRRKPAPMDAVVQAMLVA